jgi:hypothetical protein
LERNNLGTVFNGGTIPKDTQIRDVLDTVESAAVEPIFSDFLLKLQRGTQLVQYQFINNMYLSCLDGSQYFSSEKIHCPNCLVKSKKSKMRYHHQILQPAMVHPDLRQVLPLAPEQISNQDDLQNKTAKPPPANAASKKSSKRIQSLKSLSPAIVFTQNSPLSMN